MTTSKVNSLSRLRELNLELTDILAKREREKAENEKLNESITTEALDELAKQFLPKQPTDKAFEAEFCKRLLGLVNMFGDDQNDAIIQAKLGDQITRMFEKMRDNVESTGADLKRQRKRLERQNVDIEITLNQIEDCDKQLEKIRYQWTMLNWCFKICRDGFRPQVKGISGIDFGKYESLKDMPKVRQKIQQKKRLNLDLAINDKDLFLDISNQEGIVEMPEDLQ